MKSAAKTVQKEFQHPLIIRASHWINAVALTIMVASGLRIYNAHPIFAFTFPVDLTLGGWLGGARMWHFFAMWIFFVNGTVYLLYNILSKHGRRTTLFTKSDIPGVLPMIKYYLRLRKDHPPQKKYNPLQKLAYSQMPIAGLGSILTGIAIYWPTQQSWLTALFGGFDTARIWHFGFTAFFVLFTFGHLFMVAISGWWNFLSMITGWKRVAPDSHAAAPPPVTSPNIPEPPAPQTAA